MMIPDTLGRTFKVLRLSLTGVCNLACTYCVCESEAKGQKFSPILNEQLVNTAGSELQGKPLKLEEYLAIVQKIHALTPLETVRLTGGEPTLFRDLEALIKGLKDIGIPQVKMTSNGFLLDRKARVLEKAGLDAVNISLDALDPAVFFKMTRRHKLDNTLKGIEAAQAAGIKLKINCVVMKGLNESEIVPLFEYAKARNIPIRYLELMKMGHLYGEYNDYFFSEEAILWKIAPHYTLHKLNRTTSATANYWQTEDGYQFGIIANESSPFCHDCNRLRLDSFGNIYGCLSNQEGISVSKNLEDIVFLENALQQALAQKQNYKFTGSPMSMKAIGG